MNASRRRHPVDLLRAASWHCLYGGGDLHEQGEYAKRRNVGFNACDVVYDTSEEASTWRQAKAAERNTRARARRGAGDQSRRQATIERPQPTDRQAFRDGCRACRSAPPSLSSLKAASGTLLSQLSPHFRPAAIIESLDLSPGEMGNGTGVRLSCTAVDLIGRSTRVAEGRYLLQRSR